MGCRFLRYIFICQKPKNGEWTLNWQYKITIRITLESMCHAICFHAVC